METIIGSDYTGNFFTIRSSSLFDGQDVNVLEYKRNSGGVWGCCFLCGKPLKRHWFTVQTCEDDLVVCDVGPDCVKKLR